MPTSEKFELNSGIPNGYSHLLMVNKGAALARTNSKKNFEHSPGLELLGTSLCALYQAATCHRKCHGGTHILEALCGRAYNLSCAAFNLIELGFYDEALNLIRGIVEIYHFIALSTVDQKFVNDWIKADKGTRIREFSPSKIRKRIRQLLPEIELTDPNWYSDASERFVHVTPNIAPNKHNPQQSMAGGIYQEAGAKLAVGRLVFICAGLGMFICRYFKFDDLFTEISKLLKGGALPEDE